MLCYMDKERRQVAPQKQRAAQKKVHQLSTTQTGHTCSRRKFATSPASRIEPVLCASCSQHTHTDAHRHQHPRTHPCKRPQLHYYRRTCTSPPTESPTQPCLRRLNTRLPAGLLDPSPRTPGPPHTSATQQTHHRTALPNHLSLHQTTCRPRHKQPRLCNHHRSHVLG